MQENRGESRRIEVALRIEVASGRVLLIEVASKRIVAPSRRIEVASRRIVVSNRLSMHHAARG